MKANKVIEIFGLKLNKPTARIKGVTYDWDTNIARINIIFREENSFHEHSRGIEMPTNGEEVTASQVEEFIQSELPDFS